MGAGSYILKAVAYDNGGASTASGTLTITVGSGGGATTIPFPWTATDIGSPALAGSSSYQRRRVLGGCRRCRHLGLLGSVPVHFQPIAGDVDIAARVDSLTVIDPYTNAGVMIRDTLQAGSLHGY